MASRSKHHGRGLLLIAASGIVWSTGGLIARLLTVDAWTMLLWRSAFSGLFLTGLLLLVYRGRTIGMFRSLGWPGLGVAFGFAAAWSGFLVSISYTTVADALFIQAIAPFIAAGLGWLLVGERILPRTWAAMVVALAGIGLMVYGAIGSGHLMGDIIALVIPLGLATAIVLTRRHPEISMVPATCLGSVIAIAFALPMIDAPLAVSGPNFGLLALYGVWQMGVGLLLFTVGARHVPAAGAALMLNLETILSPLWVWLAVGETPGPYAIAGGAIVLAVLILHTLADLRRERTQTPTG